MTLGWQVHAMHKIIIHCPKQWVIFFRGTSSDVYLNLLTSPQWKHAWWNVFGSMWSMGAEHNPTQREFPALTSHCLLNKLEAFSFSTMSLMSSWKGHRYWALESLGNITIHWLASLSICLCLKKNANAVRQNWSSPYLYTITLTVALGPGSIALAATALGVLLNRCESQSRI